jgi:uncharacterized membrane protein YccC
MIPLGYLLASVNFLGAVVVALVGYSLRRKARPWLALVVMWLGIFLAFVSAGQSLLSQVNLNRALNDLLGQAIGFAHGHGL